MTQQGTPQRSRNRRIRRTALPRATMRGTGWCNWSIRPPAKLSNKTNTILVRSAPSVWITVVACSPETRHFYYTSNWQSVEERLGNRLPTWHIAERPTDLGITLHPRYRPARPRHDGLWHARRTTLRASGRKLESGRVDRSFSDGSRAVFLLGIRLADISGRFDVCDSRVVCCRQHHSFHRTSI